MEVERVELRRDLLRDPEVEDFGHAVRAHDDVLGLHVPVHEPAVVRGGEPARHVGEPAQPRRERDGAVTGARAERAPLHELHREVGGSGQLAFRDLVHVVDRDDVRVLELRRDPRLAQDAPRPPRRGLGSGRTRFARQDL